MKNIYYAYIYDFDKLGTLLNRIRILSFIGLFFNEY